MGEDGRKTACFLSIDYLPSMFSFNLQVFFLLFFATYPARYVFKIGYYIRPDHEKGKLIVSLDLLARSVEVEIDGSAVELYKN